MTIKDPCFIFLAQGVNRLVPPGIVQQIVFFNEGLSLSLFSVEENDGNAHAFIFLSVGVFEPSVNLFMLFDSTGISGNFLIILMPCLLHEAEPAPAFLAKSVVWSSFSFPERRARPYNGLRCILSCERQNLVCRLRLRPERGSSCAAGYKERQPLPKQMTRHPPSYGSLCFKSYRNLSVQIFHRKMRRITGDSFAVYDI